MRKAFSLIELMIVIVIIGVVYTLVITKLQSVNEEKETLSLETLKSFLYKQIQDGHRAQIVCIDDCLECKIYVDEKEIASVENLIDDSIRVYKYSYSQGLLPQEFDGCFDFSVGRDKVSDQYIVEYKEKVYDYTEYFDEVKLYNTVDECVDEKERLIQKVQ